MWGARDKIRKIESAQVTDSLCDLENVPYPLEPRILSVK